jgi:hypothetical protein
LVLPILPIFSHNAAQEVNIGKEMDKENEEQRNEKLEVEYRRNIEI